MPLHQALDRVPQARSDQPGDLLSEHDVQTAVGKVKAEGIELLPAGKQIATFKTPFEIDPNDVSVNDRLTFLLDVEAEVRAAKGVTVGRAWMDAWRTTLTMLF